MRQIRRRGLMGLVAGWVLWVAGGLGCVQVSGTRSPDGKLSISTHRFFWQSEGIEFTLTEGAGTNLSTTLKVQKSNVDSQALQAVAAGVAQGMAAGAKP